MIWMNNIHQKRDNTNRLQKILLILKEKQMKSLKQLNKIK